MDSIYRDLIAYNVSKNIPLDYHEQALKCQAIIERTLLFRKIKNKESISLDIDKENIDKRAYEAVDQTRNLVIMINNNPIMAYYHSCCGGSTENSENIINYQVDYLRKVICNECQKTKEFDQQIDIDIQDLANIFNIKLDLENINICDIDKILKVIQRDGEDRVKNLKVFNKEVKPLDFIKSLNLESTRFRFIPLKIRFYSKGIGSGLGLCQYGANEKAKNNWTFEQILNYYYTNINICTVEEFNSKFPLIGKKIFIDPGHGGRDKGNFTEDNICEKDIVLNFSIKLKEELQKYGMKVNLSRYSDEYVSLDDRIEKSKKEKYDFLISVHVNKSKFETISGIEAFYYWGDTDAYNLAKVILESISEGIKVKNRGVKQGNFYILRESIASGIYIEIGYLSNEDEKEKLKDDNFIQTMATLACEGILKYYSNKMLTYT
ncbi:SpoIID/LytB domain protein [Alkalithermobacter thermoalcaliphilus JW-YL-7 = DSM 7308]|uniref:SpoIID/LytB domain protein n=1 Tax=Alkalithermobacter thermoalcaliphilus JW-YL-7 = DSM 7308 TaxID=1121328 RepID=A0A150FML3_CLOPD|nr:SpoIID/LytB domain protein [[Clostridium] paradoxum JW-YL-7 = DSM 7308]SHL21674.1 SpoIID/LytB domain protein [[Clostridium] paradoxum JW-YL-7 = DSM 7308]